MAEIGRRVVHASGVGLPLLYLLDIVTWSQLQWILIGGMGIAGLLEGFRLSGKIDWWIYDRLTRPYEAEQVAGYALYMVSISVVAVAFNPNVAIPGMLMLMLGDPISGYLSSGDLKAIKGPVPLLAMFFVGLVIAFPFALDALSHTGFALLAAVTGAAMGTIADGIKLVIRGRIIDDNLTIPVAASIALWVSYHLFGSII